VGLSCILFAIATGRAENDPAALLRGTFKTQKPRNFVAFTKSDNFGTLVRRIKAYDSLLTRSALLLAAYTFVRTGELRAAEWASSISKLLSGSFLLNA
jgi:hypothetical protein